MVKAVNIATPFKIGKLILSNRLIQAPLAGISCAPFRSLFARYPNGQPAYSVTEMIPAELLLLQKNTHKNGETVMSMSKRYLSLSKYEGRLCVQLSGHDPNSLGRATALIDSYPMYERDNNDIIHANGIYRPDLIDLNCGCPKPKIRRKGSGSALTESLEHLRAVVTAMRQATSLPLTVKIRVAGSTEPLSRFPSKPSWLDHHNHTFSSVGSDSDAVVLSTEHNYLEAVSVIADCGADAIIVHGRHYTDGYDAPARYDQIRRVVERLKMDGHGYVESSVDGTSETSGGIPVIANGDVCDYASLKDCIEVSGATAVMIGRGSIGRPWLFQHLLSEAQKQSLTATTLSAVDRLNTNPTTSLTHADTHTPTHTGVIGMKLSREPSIPNINEIVSVFQHHIQELAELEGNQQTALLQARRLLKWYFPNLSRDELGVCYTCNDLTSLCDQIITMTSNRSNSSSNTSSFDFT